MGTQRICLDGAWEFLFLGSDGSAGGVSRTIEVPSPWQAQFADLRMRGGVAIYRRRVELPLDWLQERVFLVFGAVFHIAHVSVNGVDIGSHVGGFLPFRFDVTELLTSGAAEIAIRVESPTDDPAEFPHAPFAEIPFGKQSWYGPLSGIWQSVHLERRIADHIAHLRVLSTLETGRVAVQVRLETGLCRDSEVALEVFDPDGDLVASASTVAKADEQTIFIAAQAPSPRPWSPDSPHLYSARVSVLRGAVVADSQETAFGFREIETRDGKLYLNGKPFYLRAALDQDYYPDTICAVPSVAFIEDRFRKAKELGLNALRCHIKAPDPRYYDVADRLGLLIWAELPNGGYSTQRSRQRKEMLIKGIVDRDGNHPSIFCWTLINENWGVDLVHDASHRAWLKKLYHWLKAYDPTRLVVDNSPLAPSFHVQTDLADYHFYAAIPDSRHDWDDFVDGLASRADWLFSPEGDAVVSGDEPLLCSEFGNWGLPDPDRLKDAHGHEPWWFETGHDWGEGVMYAHGVENRFFDWSLDRVFGTFGAFVEATQWQQFRALKYQIEAMRRRPELAGYVITELSDCHWESNGLLDMRSNPRVFHDSFRVINAETVIAPKWERTAYWSGETASVRLHVAHGGSETLESAVLEVGGDGETFVATPLLPPADVADLGVVDIPLPQTDAALMHRISFRLRMADDRILAANHLNVAVHPGRQRPPGVAIWAPDPDVRERLHALGYNLVGDLQEARLVIAADCDAGLRRYVRDGGRLVLLPESEGPLTPFFPHWQNVKVLARDETLWRGDWASSFAWLRRRGAFRRLPGGPLLDETFDRVIPTHVISGCNLLDFQARVHAAMVVGWIHRPVALAVERNYGEGKVAISTFRLFRDAPGSDPTAVALLDALIETATASLVPSAAERSALDLA